ncbi:MAG: hypothetical protein HXY34_11510 [Candidatus Thorarchaeota archaeon]|nr:hypothetical protein [Candidatus Thorarchaeota archaeon]
MSSLTLDELEKWYRKRLADKSKEFTRRAERSYKVVDRALKDIQAIANELKEDAADDDDPESVGTSTRFALKLDEIVKNFGLGEEISYSNTEAMQNEIQRFIQELWGAGARWIRRMDKKHKSTIKQLDIYMKDLMQEMSRLQKLLYEFSWLKDLERIGQRINALRELGYSREVYDETIRQIRTKLEQAKKEYEEAKRELETFRQTSNVSGLLNLDEEAERVQSVLQMKLNTLKKPVKKFLQHDTGVRVGPAGQKALTDYFEDPLKAITADAVGYPALVEGLMAVREAIERGSLPLKDRRLERRAVEEIDAIRSGALAELQTKAKSIDENRRAFAGSEVYQQASRLEHRFEEASKDLEYHTNDMLRVRDEITRQLDKIVEFRARIETEIEQSFQEKVKIEMGLTLEPLLEKCTVPS